MALQNKNSFIPQDCYSSTNLNEPNQQTYKNSNNHYYGISLQNDNISLDYDILNSGLTYKKLQLTNILYDYFNDIQEILMPLDVPKYDLKDEKLPDFYKIYIIENIVKEVKKLKEIKDNIILNKKKNEIKSNLLDKIKKCESIQKENMEYIKKVRKDYKQLNDKVHSINKLVKNKSSDCLTQNKFKIRKKK